MEIKAIKEPQEQERLDRKVLRVALALKELRVVALKVPLEALELKELQVIRVTQEQMALKVPLEALEFKELQVVVLKEPLVLKETLELKVI